MPETAYEIERSAALRGWTIFSSREDNGEPGIVAVGIVKGEEGKGQRLLNKLFIPDSLMSFLLVYLTPVIGEIRDV